MFSSYTPEEKMTPPFALSVAASIHRGWPEVGKFLQETKKTAVVFNGPTAARILGTHLFFEHCERSDNTKLDLNFLQKTPVPRHGSHVCYPIYACKGADEVYIVLDDKKVKHRVVETGTFWTVGYSEKTSQPLILFMFRVGYKVDTGEAYYSGGFLVFATGEDSTLTPLFCEKLCLSLFTARTDLGRFKFLLTSLLTELKNKRDTDENYNLTIPTHFYFYSARK